MTKTVVALFSDKSQAESVIDRLKDMEYDPKDVSIVMKDTQERAVLADDTGVAVAGGAVTGATTGAILGGFAGLLASAMLPGLGAFFIGGPIAALLGLTGVAASTVSGATTGAVAGGLLGALTGLGLSNEEAQIYEEQIATGAILLAVPARIEEVRHIESMLTDAGARDVKTVGLHTDVVDTGSVRKHTDYSDRFAYAGLKGGQAKHPSRQKEKSKMKKGKKGGTSMTSRGRGWFGDSDDHSIAGRGIDVPGRGKGR